MGRSSQRTLWIAARGGRGRARYRRGYRYERDSAGFQRRRPARDMIDADRLRGDFAGETTRRGAVVEIVEPSCRDLGQNGRKGMGIGGKLAAEIIRDPDVAGKSRHQPMQRFQVLGFGGRGHQRMRAGTGGRRPERLHRRLQQDFVPCLARPRRVAIEVGAVWGECERNSGGKLVEAAIVPSWSMPSPPTMTATRGAPLSSARSTTGRA